MNLSVIGLGKLGAPLAAVFASKGYKVVGVDVLPTFVEAINAGRPPVNEPQLAELIAANRLRLSATLDFKEAIAQSDVTFMIVPTPTDSTGGFSLRFIFSAIDSIGPALRAKGRYHVVVITSTVMPGATQNEILPALEKASGLKCGVDFGLCYNPEFIALGSVVRDMLNPDFILIGESDPKAGAILEQIYATSLDNQPPISRMNFVNAELTKLSVNTFVTTKISYANMLAAMCEKLPGADVDVVTNAIGQDTRIGKKYLKGALGYGGPCFPRDNVAFSTLARQVGAPALIAEATDNLNRQQAPRLAERVRAALPPKGTVAILGLSYKPNTEVIEESSGVALAKELLASGADVVLYDPAALNNTRKALENAGRYADSAGAALRQADVVVVCTAWEEFARLAPTELKPGATPTIIDCWRVLPQAKFGGAARFVTIGCGAKS